MTEFRIADTFTTSLARLPAQEQKAAKTAAFDLQLNPAHPGLQFHRLAKAKDPNFWSVRVNRDIRLIVHRTDASLMLCYVNRHDDAYQWAERRKIETHPTTGAAQLVEIRERVEEIATFAPSADAPADEPPTELPLFAHRPDEDLLAYGVPPEWLGDVKAATESTLFDLADHLPQEAAEALLDLAVGETPAIPLAAHAADPFSHPDAQRRFRVFTDEAELAQALEYPWEKWTVFLHPAQRTYVERNYTGPARIAGSAGTGKTVVAIHRAVHLARQHPDARVLLTTFSPTLATALKVKLGRLVGSQPRVLERIEVRAIDDLALDLYAKRIGKPKLASEAHVRTLLEKAADGTSFNAQFLAEEWAHVVDAWQLTTWEAYRDVTRLGRKTRIGGKQREALWDVFASVRDALQAEGLATLPSVFGEVTEALLAEEGSAYDFVIVDEAQDMTVPAMRLFVALAAGRPDGLFLAGDQGQRIFQTPFSWKSLGVDIRGRSSILRINYRTSHQIRSQADQLLPGALTDVDGNMESRKGTVSVFNGPAPEMRLFDDERDEIEAVKAWIGERIREGYQPDEIGVIVRSDLLLERAHHTVAAAGLNACPVGHGAASAAGCISVCTMHLAKGLEFRAVVVMACDDEVIPDQERIENVTDESDLEEVYNTERHLLYVACTRARDRLLVTGVEPGSEFLYDLTFHDRQ